MPYLCSMILHTAVGNKLGELIRKGEITLGGYKKAKIYGLLNCSSGKRMKMENRVFFKDEKEAIAAGYRPCGNCLPEKYKEWKTYYR